MERISAIVVKYVDNVPLNFAFKGAFKGAINTNIVPGMLASSTQIQVGGYQRLKLRVREVNDYADTRI